MNSRERVRAALDHKPVDKVPVVAAVASAVPAASNAAVRIASTDHDARRG